MKVDESVFFAKFSEEVGFFLPPPKPATLAVVRPSLFLHWWPAKGGHALLVRLWRRGGFKSFLYKFYFVKFSEGVGFGHTSSR